MKRDFLHGVLVVVLLASAIMFALVVLQGARPFAPPPAPAFAPDVLVASTGWPPARSHVVVLSRSANSDQDQRPAGEAL